jgi:hypothetical protein
MLIHQKQNETATLKLTFSKGGGRLISNAKPHIMQAILFGVTDGNSVCASRLKVKKIEVKGTELPAIFRQMAKEIVEEVGTQEKTLVEQMIREKSLIRLSIE